jgi:HPt (histidine-containing phosphotransfer) domain-containing protein
MLKECPKLLDEIREGWRNRDAQRISRGAHTLRGSADVFAARYVVETARRLEEIGRSGTLDGTDAALADLEHEVERLLAAIRAAIGATPGGG